MESSVDLKKLSRAAIDKAMGRIALMKFFPSSDPMARATVMLELIDMCSSDDQVTWLSYRLVQLYPQQWPGIAELRACFCKRFKPADGIQVNSAVYDEFPSEAQLGPIPGLQLEASPTERDAIETASIPATRQLEAGEVSVDPDLDAEFHRIAMAHQMPVIHKHSIQEIQQELYRRRITQADVERELASRGK